MAVATDSITIAYHTVMAEGRVSLSTTVAGMGLGGLGLNRVAVTALRKTRVFGVNINTDKFKQARSLGAIDCTTTLEQFAGKMFNIILNFAGTQQTVQAAVDIVRPGGCMVLVRLAADKIQITTTSLVTQNILLRGSTSASK
jgi:propanol-preferring alcohol dehydrogenase